MDKELERKYWRRAMIFLPVLKFLPNLRFLAVCNNLAFGQVDMGSDIDLFVVARKGRLYTVRTFLWIYLQILGLRRHGRKIAGRFCLSFLIDEELSNLRFLALGEDFYLAYWLKSLKPVIAENGFSEYFVRKNFWMREFWPSGTNFGLDQSHLVKIGFESRFFRFLYLVLFDFWFGWILERFLVFFQKRRALRKFKKLNCPLGIQISDQILKFHNLDRRQRYNSLWLKRFGSKTKLNDQRFLTLKAGL